MIRPVQVMIVGAQKAGTSSLKSYLGEHPDVCVHKRNEITCFISDEEYALGYNTIFERYYGHLARDHAVVLGKSVGIMYLPEAARRLKAHNPDVHVIVVLRHPVDRAYSAFWYARGKGWEDIERFEQAIWADSHRFKEPVKQRNCAYLFRSLYAMHLEMLIDVFGRERVQVFLFEDLKSDPISICQQIFRRIGVDHNFVPGTGKRYNTASRPVSARLAHLIGSDNILRATIKAILPEESRHALKERLRKAIQREFTPPALASETRRQLLEFFREHNELLAAMIGRDLRSWNET